LSNEPPLGQIRSG